MKKIRLFAAAVMIFLSVSSCSVLSAISGQNSTSLENGLKVGAALLGLYSQYKGAGMIDMTSLGNINNVAKVVSGIQDLKQYNNNQSLLSDFAQGLINGSSNLVNQNNAYGVVNNLLNLSQNDLSGTSNAAAILATQAATKLAQNKFMSGVYQSESNDGKNLTTAVNSLSAIMSLLK